VAPHARYMGVGRALGSAFIKIAPALGYRASLFNLVFVSNIASVKLWRSLGYMLSPPLFVFDIVRDFECVMRVNRI
jgi:ribosomal protein S18 acetylase RimI-like enzyme